jgi:lambda family phage tail tape measure protein
MAGDFSAATGATAWGSEHGNLVSGGQYKAFAHGGIVTSPTVFPMANGAGLMGEAGAEAIMPLSRMSGGDLGVKSAPMNVTVNNNAGVDVQTSQDSSGGLTIDIVRQVIAADIAGGGNSVARSIEQSYGIGRGAGAFG